MCKDARQPGGHHHHAHMMTRLNVTGSQLLRGQATKVQMPIISSPNSSNSTPLRLSSSHQLAQLTSRNKQVLVFYWQKSTWPLSPSPSLATSGPSRPRHILRSDWYLICLSLSFQPWPNGYRTHQSICLPAWMHYMHSTMFCHHMYVRAYVCPCVMNSNHISISPPTLFSAHATPILAAYFYPCICTCPLLITWGGGGGGEIRSGVRGNLHTTSPSASTRTYASETCPPPRPDDRAVGRLGFGRAREGQR